MWSGSALRRARAVRQPRILMYHGIADSEVSAQLFGWQLECLANEFELLPLDRLVDRLARRSTTGHEVAITFDDGVVNHFCTVYPLLRTHRACATFFVCPGLIESGRWIWNMELRLRLRLLSATERQALATAEGCAGADVETLIGWAKQLPLPRREAFEDVVRQQTQNFDPAPAEVERNAPMSWDQLKALDTAVVTIGSHTVSHPILTTLDEAGRRAEIGTSRALLQSRLGRDVDLFCYPNGDNDAGTAAIARDTYRAAVTTQAGFAGADSDLARIPRIPAGESAALFLRRLHRPTA
jgi:peptidoglycan/xylan/chitin deacetylase (PgdA/CDA1 family)